MGKQPKKVSISRGKRPMRWLSSTPFRSNSLHGVSARRLELRPTWGTTLQHLILMGAGVLILSGSLASPPACLPIGGLFGGLFILSSLRGLLYRSQILVFDKDAGYFWAGGGPYRQDKRPRRAATPLAEICGLQLLAKHFDSPDEEIYAWELNLVLADGKRICVEESRTQTRLEEHARQIAQFLGTEIYRD